MKTTYLNDTEVEIIGEIMKRHKISVLTPNVFWFTVRSFVPNKRLQQLSNNKKRVYEEYKRNIWLDKINFK